MFPLRIDETLRYVETLATVGVERGLIGPREAPRIWQRHIFNCAVIAPIFARGSTVADIGSGAGLPGLVLALSRPDLRLTLIEPLRRRAVFLNEVMDELGLTNVNVIAARAEELRGTNVYDAVTARAVAPLGRLAKWAIPLCRSGGELVAMKGAAAQAELRTAMPLLQEMTTGDGAVEQIGEGVVWPLTTVVRIRSGGQMHVPAPDKDS